MNMGKYDADLRRERAIRLDYHLLQKGMRDRSAILSAVHCSSEYLNQVLGGAFDNKRLWDYLWQTYGISRSLIFGLPDDAPVAEERDRCALTARIGGTGPVDRLEIGGVEFWGRQQGPSDKTVAGTPTYVLLHGLALTPAIFQDWFWQTPHFHTVAPYLEISEASAYRSPDDHARMVSRLLRALASVGRTNVVLIGFSVGADIVLSPAFDGASHASTIMLMDPNFTPSDCFFSAVLAEAGAADPKRRPPERRLLVKMLGELGDDLGNPGDFEAKMWYFSEVLHQLRLPSAATGVPVDAFTLATYSRDIIREAGLEFHKRMERLLANTESGCRVVVVASRDGQRGFMEVRDAMPPQVIATCDVTRGHFDLLGYDTMNSYLPGLQRPSSYSVKD